MEDSNAMSNVLSEAGKFNLKLCMYYVQGDHGIFVFILFHVLCVLTKLNLVTYTAVCLCSLYKVYKKTIVSVMMNF